MLFCLVACLTYNRLLMSDQPEIQLDTVGSTAGANPPQVATATVGIFDSGIGGFTVAREILALRPDVNLVYYGDSLNVPYGDKSPGQIARMAKHSIEFLVSHGIDILAVGCNASNSVLGQGELKSFGLPVFDLVTSTISHLQELPELPGSLALVATVASINSGYWQRKLAEAFPQLKILEIAAPSFVPLVEAGTDGGPDVQAAIQQILQVCKDQEVYTILHGCTHYPMLEGVMQSFCPEFKFIDPAVCLADKLVNHLSPAEPSAPSGSRAIFCSLPSKVFYQAGETALGFPIRSRTSMYIVNPFED